MCVPYFIYVLSFISCLHPIYAGKHFILQGREPYEQGNKKINKVLVVSGTFTLIINHKVIKLNDISIWY